MIKMEKKNLPVFVNTPPQKNSKFHYGIEIFSEVWYKARRVAKNLKISESMN